jgi:hypothetical protein
MSVVPSRSWSAVNEPLEFVGWQEMVFLHVRSFSTIDAVSERKFPRRLGDLRSQGAGWPQAAGRSNVHKNAVASNHPMHTCLLRAIVMPHSHA